MDVHARSCTKAIVATMKGRKFSSSMVHPAIGNV